MRSARGRTCPPLGQPAHGSGNAHQTQLHRLGPFKQTMPGYVAKSAYDKCGLNGIAVGQRKISPSSQGSQSIKKPNILWSKSGMCRKSPIRTLRPIHEDKVPKAASCPPFLQHIPFRAIITCRGATAPSIQTFYYYCTIKIPYKQQSKRAIFVEFNEKVRVFLEYGRRF